MPPPSTATFDVFDSDVMTAEIHVDGQEAPEHLPGVIHLTPAPAADG